MVIDRGFDLISISNHRDSEMFNEPLDSQFNGFVLRKLVSLFDFEVLWQLIPHGIELKIWRIRNLLKEVGDCQIEVVDLELIVVVIDFLSCLRVDFGGDEVQEASGMGLDNSGFGIFAESNNHIA